MPAAPHLSLPTTMRINWLGMATLYRREVWRFLKVWNQTLLAPMVNGLLFLAIFSLALGGHMRTIHGLPFDLFIAPGLISMAVMQNAFANSSSSLMLSKMQGVIIDLLMPPLNAAEITGAIMLGGITRGLLVGVVSFAALWVFVPMHIHHPLVLLYFLLMASAFMALMGLLCGLWAHTFDQMSALTNYIITPLTFLSGTFYSVRQLPDMWFTVSQYNPFFYIIDGMRYALTHAHDGSLVVGMIYVAVLDALLVCACVYVLHKGYRLKA